MICRSNCDECAYPECIREKRDKEVHQRYYQKHRQQRLDYQRAYNEMHRKKKDKK